MKKPLGKFGTDESADADADMRKRFDALRLLRAFDSLLVLLISIHCPENVLCHSLAGLP